MTLADSFVVGVEDLNYYPYFDFSTNAENPSFVKALLDEFAKDNGHQITYLPLPIKQFPKWLHEENIDFKFPDNERWQDINNIYGLDIAYSDEIVRLNSGTLVLAKNSHKQMSTIKNLGTVTGFHPTLWVEKISQGKVVLFEDPSPRILVQYLVNGLIDGLLIDLDVANNELKKMAIKEEVVYSQHLPQQVFAYQMSTVKHPKVLQQFNQWQVQKREFIRGLKEQFGILQIEPRATVGKLQ